MTGPMADPADRWDSSLLALILATASAFRLAQLDGLPPFIDESAGLVLSVDYQSWDVWSRLLHGKLLGYLWFKPIFLLAWDPLYAARLFSALIGVLAVALFYWLLVFVVSRKAALAGTAFLAFMPIVVFHDRLALFDGFMAACLIAAVLLYLCSKVDHPLMLLAAGFLLGIAVFTKVYALLAILIWLPVLRRRSVRVSRSLMTIGLGFVVCVLVTAVLLATELKPGLQYLQAALGAPNRFVAPKVVGGERLSLAFEQLGQIFGYLQGYNGWTFLPVLALCAVVPGSRHRLRLEILAAWLFSCVILAVAFRFLFSRYLLPGLPALAVLVALTFEDCTERIRNRSRPRGWAGIAVLLLVIVCVGGFVYRDARIAAQSLEGVLPSRDGYQYLWGAPSGFGLREIADELQRLDLADDRKLICVTRGMGTGTHGAATLPLLLRHAPIRFVHLWLQSAEDIKVIRNLPRDSRIVVFVDEPDFVNDRLLVRLGASSKPLFAIKGATGRPDYALLEIIHPLTHDDSSSSMKP